MGKTHQTELLAISSRGVDYGETPEDAMYRELYEELGLQKVMLDF